MATLSQPIAMAVRVNDPSVYVAEKAGRVKRLAVNGDSASVAGTILDISDLVTTAGNEQGLLGITFSPDGSKLYVDYTNTDGDTRVVEYPMVGGNAARGSARVLLAVHQPFANHNGGEVVFGPDNLLYIGLGDGGGGGDPSGNGQNLGVLLGKILRIDPTPTSGRPYSIPAGNPFVGQSGARAEIWHYGLRNPWRFTFDRATHEQWIADVGQDAYEEVDHIAAARGGVNFGWNKREGKHAYKGGAIPAGALDPQLELSHSDGNCSVTGGYVYRGSAIRGLAGTYVFADLCKGRLLGASGSSAAIRDLGADISQPTTFGEDASGELWVFSYAGPVYKLTRA
jgi:glucose/arabinose dehydrogenase